MDICQNNFIGHKTNNKWPHLDELEVPTKLIIIP